MLKIKNKCKNLNKDRAFNPSMFDDGLKYVYNELYTKFNDFRKTNEFKYLSDRIIIAVVLIFWRDYETIQYTERS